MASFFFEEIEKAIFYKGSLEGSLLIASNLQYSGSGSGIRTHEGINPKGYEPFHFDRLYIPRQTREPYQNDFLLSTLKTPCIQNLLEYSQSCIFIHSDQHQI